MSNGTRAKRERALRLQAVHIASMLPDDEEEAQRVLDYVQRIVSEFITLEKTVIEIVKRGEK